MVNFTKADIVSTPSAFLNYYLTGLHFGASNISLFSALPGGALDSYGAFNFIGAAGYWWSSSAYGSSPWYRYLNYSSANANRNFDSKQNGFSVRCIKD
jgi:uncharacterized protein (TIGR02145 family)